uniref:Uncharacterized protein n=1 Tax=Aegilops tauschii subsp. strangulata TaxID=200361 RepID=A0A453J7P3_AEGTS
LNGRCGDSAQILHLRRQLHYLTGCEGEEACQEPMPLSP